MRFGEQIAREQVTIHIVTVIAEADDDREELGLSYASNSAAFALLVCVYGKSPSPSILVRICSLVLCHFIALLGLLCFCFSLVSLTMPVLIGATVLSLFICHASKAIRLTLTRSLVVYLGSSLFSLAVVLAVHSSKRAIVNRINNFEEFKYTNFAWTSEQICGASHLPSRLVCCFVRLKREI